MLSKFPKLSIAIYNVRSYFGNHQTLTDHELRVKFPVDPMRKREDCTNPYDLVDGTDVCDRIWKYLIQKDEATYYLGEQMTPDTIQKGKSPQYNDNKSKKSRPVMHGVDIRPGEHKMGKYDYQQTAGSNSYQNGKGNTSFYNRGPKNTCKGYSNTTNRQSFKSSTSYFQNNISRSKTNYEMENKRDYATALKSEATRAMDIDNRFEMGNSNDCWDYLPSSRGKGGSRDGKGRGGNDSGIERQGRF